MALDLGCASVASCFSSGETLVGSNPILVKIFAIYFFSPPYGIGLILGVAYDGKNMVFFVLLSRLRFCLAYAIHLQL